MPASPLPPVEVAAIESLRETKFVSGAITRGKAFTPFDGSRFGRVFRLQDPGPAVCVAQFLGAKLREIPYLFPFLS